MSDNPNGEEVKAATADSSAFDDAARIEMHAARVTMDRATARWLSEHQRLSGVRKEDPDA